MCSMDIFHSMLLFILVLKNEILAVRQFIPPPELQYCLQLQTNSDNMPAAWEMQLCNWIWSDKYAAFICLYR